MVELFRFFAVNGIDFARSRFVSAANIAFCLARLVYGNGTRTISRIAAGIFRNSRVAQRS